MFDLITTHGLSFFFKITGKKSVMDLSMLMQCFYVFFVIFCLLKVLCCGLPHLNCIDKWMQFKWVYTAYALIK